MEWDGEDERARVSLLSMPTGCFLTASNRPPCCDSGAHVASGPSSPTVVVGMGWGSGSVSVLRLWNWTKVRRLSSETEPGSTHSFQDFPVSTVWEAAWCWGYMHKITAMSLTGSFYSGGILSVVMTPESHGIFFFSFSFGPQMISLELLIESVHSCIAS